MLDSIASRRRDIYRFYRQGLRPLAAENYLRLPHIPEECESNYHMFYILLPDRATRDGLMAHLQASGIHAVFHYVPLHSSPMGRTFGYKEGDFPVTEDLSGRLLRLPLFYEITEEEQTRVVHQIDLYCRANPARVRRDAALALST